MKTKMSKQITRFLTVAIMLLTMLASAIPAFAAGGTGTAAGSWQQTASDIVTKGGGVGSDDELAQRLSRVAGGGTFNDAGAEYYSVVVQAGAAGTKYYVNGSVRNFAATGTSLTAAPSSGKYSANAVTVNTTSGGTATATVWQYTNLDAAAQGKIQANISAGLLSQSNVTPDTGTAMNLLSGVMPMINTLLGLIVVVISIGMTVFSALDIIYLAFPAFRGKIDEQVEAGGKGTKQNKDGSTSSKWVTDDARISVRETLEAGLQPWGAYFKRRVLAYIFLAIILFILLTGNIFAITTLVTNALQGLFSSLHIG